MFNVRLVFTVPHMTIATETASDFSLTAKPVYSEEHNAFHSHSTWETYTTIDLSDSEDLTDMNCMVL